MRNTVVLVGGDEIGISPSRSIAILKTGYASWGGRRDEGKEGLEGKGGGISVVAVKSGGKWEIQRPGDKWLITMVVGRWLASSVC